jgi:hypothetical protein
MTRKLIAFALSFTLTLCGLATAQNQQSWGSMALMRAGAAATKAEYRPLWITPIMTGSNAPSGLVTASSSFSAARLPWFAMDGDIGADNDAWTSTINSFPNWLQYQSASSNSAKQFMVIPYPNNGPRDFTFQGSSNGTDWTTLSAGTVPNSVAAGYKWVYQFTNNTTPFCYYRITTTNGYSGYTVIAEIDVSSGIDVPFMTSASNPAPFVVTESSRSSVGFAGWKAFDDAAPWSPWQSAVGLLTQEWVSVDLGSPKVADIVVVRNTLNSGFNHLSVSGSSDGQNYSVLMTTNAANTASPQRFALNNAEAYRYYKISTTNGHATNMVSVSDIRLIHAP